MSKYYTPYELTQRLDAIPTVTIHTFEEPYHQEGQWTATVEVHFPEEFDETAYEQVQKVVDEASHWRLDEEEDPTSEITTVYFSIDSDAPTKLKEKFELNKTI